MFSLKHYGHDLPMESPRKFETIRTLPSATSGEKPGVAHQLANTIPMVKHDGDNIRLCGCCYAAGMGRLVRVEGRKNAAKYREVSGENLHYSAHDLRLG